MGVVIVLIILSYLLLSFTSIKFEVKRGFDDIDIDVPIKTCIDFELENALIRTGYQGGYLLNFPEEYIDNKYSGVPYWLYNGVYTIPSKDLIEDEIALYLEDKVPLCIDFTLSEQYPIKINDIEAYVSIYDEMVIADVDVMASINLGDIEKKTGMFNSINYVGLGKMIDQAQASILEMIDVAGIPMTWLTEQEYPSFVIEHEDGYVIEIVDYDIELKEEPYTLYYAVSFPEPDNSPPLLYPEGPFKGYVNEEVYVDFDAEDDAYEDQLYFSIVTFEPYNTMEINSSTGEISFIPLIDGKYSAYVKVTDVEGLTDTQYLDIEVELR